MDAEIEVTDLVDSTNEVDKPEETDMLEIVVTLGSVKLLEAAGSEVTEMLLVPSELAVDVDTELLDVKEEVTVEGSDIVELASELLGATEELRVALIEGELSVELLGMTEVVKVELMAVVERDVVTGMLVDMEVEVERQEHALERRDAGY